LLSFKFKTTLIAIVT